MYPIRDEIWQLSPQITSGTGYVVPIFGSMATTSYLMIAAAVYLMLFHGNKLLANAGAVLIIGYTVAIFQARTLYLTLIAIFAFMILYRRSSVGNIGVVALLSGFLLGLISLIGLQFQGRLGASFDANFLIAHFMAIFGVCDTSLEGVCSAAEGVGQRLEWWNSIAERMLADPFNLLLGLGYGVTLTDFYGCQRRGGPRTAQLLHHGDRADRDHRRGLLGADHDQPGPPLARHLQALRSRSAGARVRTG